MGSVAPDLERMTLAAWAARDEDAAGELVDGRLEEEEVPTYAHEVVVAWLLATLRAWVAPRGGFALASETKVRVRDDRGRKPDVVVFFPGRRLPPRGASIGREAPDVVVEVVTATPRDGRRDRVEKRADYAEAGVGQYWLVDPELRTLEILHLRDGRYADALVVADGEHDVPGCPDLTLDLDALWSELDRWPTGE